MAIANFKSHDWLEISVVVNTDLLCCVCKRYKRRLCT